MHPKSTESTTLYVTLLRTVLQSVPERSRAILLSRFGISGPRKKTLESIGREYSITRERVRQIVDAALKNMRQTLVAHEHNEVLKTIREKIQSKQGIVPVTALLDELAGDSVAERGALLALLHSLPGTKILKETKERVECIVESDFSMTEWKKMIGLVQEIFSEKNDVLTLPELLGSISNRLTNQSITEEKLENFIAPSTVIGKNVFGRYGLSEWSSIVPRGTRERAYLILKMSGKPLHFREIARSIDEYGLARAGKSTHPQTVHNELIKDKRFVLVGRGTYALEAWGYKPGTVRQVLADILKQGAKPMTKEELLQAVMKVRRVKKSTIVINLNTFFTKVGKNIYTLGKS